LDWLIDELVSAAQSHVLVVWASAAPWIVDDQPETDQWGGYPEERARIADAIAAAGVKNLVMVSGDFHISAIDDGTNSGYAADGTRGFPVLHAGPLDRPGVPAGGPYSHGAVAESGQFGKLEIDDDGGSTIRVRLSGESWDGTALIELEVDVDVPSNAVST
jgi:hypothetical protein